MVVCDGSIYNFSRERRMDNISNIDTGTKDHDYILELFGGVNSVMVGKINKSISDWISKEGGGAGSFSKEIGPRSEGVRWWGAGFANK